MSTPLSTYRLQFHAGFTFADATAIIPYLKRLGISHVYASPYFKAKVGSTHGYDVIDHSALNPEIGSQSDFETFVSVLKSNGLSHILDIVPNHTGVATNENIWWNDVLENGPTSAYANYFDIAWKASTRSDSCNKLLLPVLGEPYGAVLEAGQLQLKFETGGLFVCYYDRRFPLAPETYADVVGPSVAARLPQSEIKTALADLVQHASDVRASIESRIAQLNGSPGNPASFDALDAILDRQHYRLASWRVASDEINYRRFFDINDLAALAMEREEVFNATHEFLFRLIREGKLAGLRVDHPDGLYDPRQYFQRLQAASPIPGLYVVVEKILAFDETLPSDWPVSGTTGYDFLAKTNGLFVDPSAVEEMTRIYHQFIGDQASYPDLVYQNKCLILNRSFSSELHMLARQLHRLACRDRHSRDFAFTGLRNALGTLIACFPVYRSYVAQDTVHPSDRQNVNEAVESAMRGDSQTAPEIFHYIRDMIVQSPRRGFTGQDREVQLRFAGKFQQLTAPVTAKGIEDTTFYVYNRLISLNEVGGDPDYFGTAPEALHAYFQDRQQNWAGGLSPLSTHDTKRSEDVRARINVLSEIPDQWGRAVARWRELNAIVRGPVHPNDEYLLYQTLIGAWPINDVELAAFLQRIQAYLQKALREAKVRTSWTNPDEKYEKAVNDFAAGILDAKSSEAFIAEFRELQKAVCTYGFYNSLSQTLLRLTAPGVPDTYQGSELWDLSLVDPDNRRPVNYAAREKMLAALHADINAVDRGTLIQKLLRSMEDGRIKLFTATLGLHCRRSHAALFSSGEYLPLNVIGAKARHVFAFARRHEAELAIVIIARYFARLLENPARVPIGHEVWCDTAILLPDNVDWFAVTDVFSAQTVHPRSESGQRVIALSDAIAHFPVSLLLSETR